jgi:hypothetical protein
MIKPNEGQMDRIIRIVVGVVALLAGFFFQTGLLQIIAYVIGVAALITGLVGFCGLYAVLGISTCPMKKSKS